MSDLGGLSNSLKFFAQPLVLVAIAAVVGIWWLMNRNKNKSRSRSRRRY